MQQEKPTIKVQISGLVTPPYHASRRFPSIISSQLASTRSSPLVEQMPIKEIEKYSMLSMPVLSMSSAQSVQGIRGEMHPPSQIFYANVLTIQSKFIFIASKEIREKDQK